MHTIDFSITNYTDPIIDGINAVLPKLPAVIFGVLVGILLIRVVGRATKFLLAISSVQPGLRGVIASIAETVLWVFLAIKTLEGLGFNNIIVFFTGSIAAIGIAMAAGGSTLVSDIIAGIFLGHDRDFNVGDEIIAGETPTQGVVMAMDARRVRIRDEAGAMHIIPNSVIERKEWVVVSKATYGGAIERAVSTARRISTVAAKGTSRFRRQ